jgi:hypothetical protein
MIKEAIDEMITDAVTQLFYLLIGALTLLAIYHLGRASVSQERVVETVVDTVEVAADFEQKPNPLRPRARIVFAPTEVVDTVEVVIPEVIRDTCFVTGPNPIDIGRPLFGIPTVTLTRFDPRSGRGIEERFDVRPPNLRYSLYLDAGRDLMGVEPTWRVGVGSEVRYSRFALTARLSASRELQGTVGVRYYFTTY